MCPMEKIASCQITFTPIVTEHYIDDIDRVLVMIESSGLEYEVGLLSTTIRGNREKILALIADINRTMDDVCGFTMDIKISNVCGCRIS